MVPRFLSHNDFTNVRSELVIGSTAKHAASDSSSGAPIERAWSVASFLIDALQLERKTASGKILYRAEKGNCHILGIAGMTNQDHFDHFYNAADLIKRTSLDDAPSAQ